jgi:Domain of unknown function (DUF4340)
MSRDKLILIGVVLLGLLGFLVFQQAKRDEALGQPLASTKDFPSIGAPDDIDKISITNGDKGEVVLEKVSDPKGQPTDGGTATIWELTRPTTAVANQQNVKDLLANLKELKVDGPVNLKLDDEVRKDKQLDAAHAVHVVAWKGSDKKVDDFFGKSGTAGQLVTVAAQPDAVWAAKGYSSYLYTKEAKDFRDKELLKFDDANVAHVSIANTHGVLSFTKAEKWAGTWDKKPIVRFDEEKVRDMLRAFKALNAEDFGDGKALAETGLDKPDGTVRIELKDGAGTYELLVGKVASGTNRWAKKANDDQIFQITSYASEFVLSDSSKYQSAVDAGVGDAGGAKPTKK